MKTFLIVLSVMVATVYCGHFLNADGTPYDPYHNLHVPHNPPLYPTYHKVPYTGFSCKNLGNRLWVDVAAQCQVCTDRCSSLPTAGNCRFPLNYRQMAYHLCHNGRLVSSYLCGNGTLFNEQFQVCDQFYNVRCGSPYEDL